MFVVPNAKNLAFGTPDANALSFTNLFKCSNFFCSFQFFKFQVYSIKIFLFTFVKLKKKKFLEKVFQSLIGLKKNNLKKKIQNLDN